MILQDNIPEEEIDYTGLVIKDMYTILTTQPDPWPKTYTKIRKLEFIDKMIRYLTDNEEYEMCDGMKKMKDKILTEPLKLDSGNRRKTRKRG